MGGEYKKMKSRSKKVFITSLFSALSVCLVGGVAALNGSQAQEAYAAELEEYVLENFKIKTTAEVRMSEPNGIRFTVNVPEEVKTQYSGYTFGTLLLPENMLGDNELTFSTEMCLDIPASKWQDDDTYTSVLAGKETSDGEFENLPESYYNRPIVARAYITNGTQVYYSSNTTTRSIGYVAKMNILTGTSNSELLQTIADKTDIAFADSITLSTVAGSDILYNTIKNAIDAPKLLVGDYWNDERVVTMLRKWVADGHGFIGVGEPTAHRKGGRCFVLADVLGVDKEKGFTLSEDKYNIEKKAHFITADASGEIDYGEGQKNIYALAGADVLDIEISLRFKRNVNVGEVKLAANAYEKGRGVYMAGLPYSPQNARLLLRALYWAAGKEGDLCKAYSSNPVTDCSYYPESKQYAIINNTFETQATTFYDVNGKAQELILKPNDIIWIEE